MIARPVKGNLPRVAGREPEGPSIRPGKARLRPDGL